MQQASARADVERLRERLCAAEHAAAASEKSASDIKAQLHVRLTHSSSIQFPAAQTIIALPAMVRAFTGSLMETVMAD